ncbi:MAG TPA: DUF3172 domain-containing protein [Prochlorococcaceae cyanobacterium AMR_MDS_5431]|nr:DUF3172 domain-containing protein [Prochlorococcaceae cyanobacterium AMR_MDS_5431]
MSYSRNNRDSRYNKDSQRNFYQRNSRLNNDFIDQIDYDQKHFERNVQERKNPGSKSISPFQFNIGTAAILAGVLIIGIGIGTGISSTSQGNQGNIASSQQLDMAVADPEFCKQWGASAFVMDLQTYTTMNPSTSFVSQPRLQPGCVIRRENWSVLQKEGVINADQMRECKQRMNTFAYIGSVRDKPEVRCVYQTDLFDNKFQNKGITGDSVSMTSEANKF